MANKGDIYKVALPNGDEYNFKDKYVRENYRALNNNDFDTINVTELNSGNLINTGAARFLNTINGSISGNAATASDSAKLNGYASDTSATNNTIARRTANGYIFATYFNQSSGAETPTSSSYIIYANSDGYFRKSTVGNMKTAMSLNNVENKSSATIRGELTSSNVTTALGYTPVNKAGDTMSGSLHFSSSAPLVYDWVHTTESPMIVLKDSANYGIRYKEGDPDTMKFSASGNANTNNADLCINGAGDGTVTIRGNTIIHTGNYTSYTVKKDGTGASGTWGISISGNATTATTANSVAWGNVSGRPTKLSQFTNDITFATSIASSTDTSEITLAHNGVYAITAGGTSFVFKMPSSGNTDTKVRQTATTTDASYEVLFSETADNTTRTEGARKSNGLIYNPSTGELIVRNDDSPGTSRISTYGVYVKDCQATPTQSNQFGYYQWGDQVQFTYRNASNAYLGQAFCIYVTDGHSEWNKTAIYKANMYPNTTDTYYSGDSNRKWKGVYATTFYGDLSGNATSATTATSATKATQDGSGNVITSTYLKLSGGTMTGQITSNYNQAASWLNCGKYPDIHINNTGASGWIGGNTKTGRHVICTYASNDDLLYFNWYSNTTLAGTENKFDKSFTWNPATNILSTNISGNASTATKATQDESGNNIKASYAASFSISDHTITLKNKNGESLGTVTVPDNNTTYSAGTGLALSGTTFRTTVPRVAKDSHSLPGQNTCVVEEYTNGTNYNLPSNHYYHIYSSQGSDVNYGCQLALGMTTAGVYYREYNNKTWGSWRSLINTDTNTHRPIQMNGTEILGNNTTALNLKAGTNVSLSNSSGTVTIAATDTNTWRGIQDNLTSSTNTTESLSAKQGYLLANGSARDNTKVAKAGDTMTGLLTTKVAATHTGVKFGDTYQTAIDGDVIFQNNNAIRFGGDAWDWNVWAGLKYDSTNKIVYLGVADKTIFHANQAQTGSLKFPGITHAYLGGTLHLTPVTGNYTEGIRIHSYGSWSDIILCGNDNTGDSGTSVNSWFLGNNNGNFYLTRNGSSSGTSMLSCVSNAWKFVGNVTVPILGIEQTNGTSGGISLYGGTSYVESYGICFRKTSNRGVHGYVSADWATYFTQDNTANRGWVFQKNGSNTASISSEGNMVLNGSLTLGGNTTNTSGVRQIYNSATQSLDFVFVA